MVLNRFRKVVAVERGIPSIPTSSLVHGYLTDNGSDTSLNENYASATDAYYTASQPMVVQSICLELTDGDIAQSTDLGEGFVGTASALTNGLKLRIEDASGTKLVDISDTVAIKNMAQLYSVATVVEKSDVTDATSTNNFHTVSARINLESLFGKAIEINNTDRIVCVLEDNFSGLTQFNIHFFGYLI